MKAIRLLDADDYKWVQILRRIYNFSIHFCMTSLVRARITLYVEHRQTDNYCFRAMTLSPLQ